MSKMYEKIKTYKQLDDYTKTMCSRLTNRFKKACTQSLINCMRQIERYDDEDIITDIMRVYCSTVKTLYFRADNYSYRIRRLIRLLIKNNSIEISKTEHELMVEYNRISCMTPESFSCIMRDFKRGNVEERKAMYDKYLKRLKEL